MYTANTGGVLSHGGILNMQPVIEYAGYFAGDVAEDAFTHGYHGGACGAHVFLCAGIDQGVFIEIHLAAEDVAAHVR